MKLKPTFFLLICAFIVHFIFVGISHDVEASESSGDTVPTIGIEESVSEALANSPSIRIKREAMEEASNARKKARAGFLPELSTSYGYTRVDTPPRLKNVDMREIVPNMVIPKWEYGTEDNYQWKITAKQPLFTGFALVSAYELARLGIDLSKLEFEKEKLDLVLMVNEVYFNILRADKTLDVAEKAVDQLKSHLNEAQDIFEAGIIPINELLKSEVELANVQHSLTKAQNATRLTRSAFNTILSRPINDPVEVKDILFHEPTLPDIDECLEKACRERPEVKIFDINIRQTDQQIRLTRSKYYPEIGLSVDYINAGDDPDVSGSDYHVSTYWQTMAGVSWSFWQWGKTHYSTGGAISRRKQLVHAKSGIMDKIRLEVKEAVLDLDSAAKNIPTTEKSVKQGEENMRVSKERYHNQLTTSTEVLDAQTLLTQARLNYYNSLYDYNLALARLKHAMGER